MTRKSRPRAKGPQQPKGYVNPYAQVGHPVEPKEPKGTLSAAASPVRTGPDHLSVASSPPTTFKATSKPVALAHGVLKCVASGISSRKRRQLS